MDNFIHGKGQAALSMCGCGRLHFTYGPIALHFEPEEFARFVDEVNRLATHLQHVVSGRKPVLTPGHDGPICH